MLDTSSSFFITFKSMCLLSISMCSVLENKRPGSNEEQTVKIHPAAVARGKPPRLRVTARKVCLSDTLHLN